ncbi:MAG: exodeoxyribonuclease V subunit gamma [Oligoflexales bacterium]|nr:exodeoxyribonuclease V subunit gamma [Oligoflexales bacterium]
MTHQHADPALTIFSPDTCLITALIKKLASLDLSLLEKSLVILPTQRLVTAFNAALAVELGACFPPKTMTLEQFIWENSGYPREKCCPDFLIDIILGSIIQKGGMKHVMAGHEREIRLFFSEITGAGIGLHAFTLLKNALSDDIHKSDTHLSSLVKRISEMEEITERLNATLSGLGLSSQTMATVNAAGYLAEKLDIPGALPYHECYFIGFTSVLKSLEPLLSRLIKMKNVHFWMHEDPLDDVSESPLSALTKMLAGAAGLDCPAPSGRKSASAVIVNNAGTPLAESALALVRCKELISQGISPSKIAILVTSESDYGPLLKSLTREMGLKVNLAIKFPLGSTPAGVWLKKLSDFVLGAGTARHFLDLATAGTTVTWLLKNEIFSGFDDRTLRTMLVSEISRLKTLEGRDGTLNGGLSREAGSAVSMVLDAMGLFSGRRKAPQPFIECVREFENIISTFQPFETNENEMEHAATMMEVTDQFIASLQIAAENLNYVITPGEFMKAIVSQLLKAEIHTTGEPLEGVQILGLSEARHMPFHAVLVLGCNEGSFPKGLPRDDLLDDFLKRQTGLPGWNTLEAMEDLTFSLLRERIPHLELFRAREDNDGPLVKSRFISKLECEGLSISRNPDFDPSVILCGLDPSREVPQDLPQKAMDIDTEGLIEADLGSFLKTMSASSLETFIKCPYRFLLSRLMLSDLVIPGEDEDRREEGEWLHGILEAFFSSHFRGERVTSDLPAELDAGSFYDLALSRLLSLTERLAPENIAGTPLFYHLKSHSWPSFARHLIKCFGNGISMIHNGLREFRFVSGKADRTGHISILGRRRELEGMVDSIERMDDLHIICDYKRKSIPSRGEVERGTSPQLAFYSAALESLSMQYPLGRVIAGYWNIIEGKWEPRGVGDDVRDKAIAMGLATKKTPLISAAVEAFKSLWEFRETDVLLDERRFYADITDCGLCRFSDICRKDDPGNMDYFENRKKLSDHLSKNRAADNEEDENFEYDRS